MTDDEQQLRRIDWAACFPFVHVFRAFRLAVNPRVLGLLLVAVFLTYLVGTGLDAVWPVAPGAGNPATAAADGTAGDAPLGVYAEFSARVRGAGEQACFPVLHGQPLTTPHGCGAVAFVTRIAEAKLWLLTQHPVFAVLFFVLTLAIWAFFGGAACRIIALHATRDERISIREALRFSRAKILSLFAAPLIPYGLILAVGLFLIVGGVIGAIPAVGELFAGFLLILALIGGFLIAVVLIGATAGTGLMWPTISVEGSDAFDAISRSFSYVFARPWHAALYAGVSFVYGSICYLFVRLVVWLILVATHVFVGAGMTLFGLVNQRDNGLGKLDVMWHMPTFDSLVSTPPWSELAGTELVAAALIFMWVWVVVGLLYAFVASFFFSGTTLIYFLLRRDVDATDLEEIYVEEEEEEAAVPETAPAAQVEPPAPGPAPSEPAPPPEEAADEGEKPDAGPDATDDGEGKE